MTPCPLCTAPVLPGEATEQVLGMATHAECAAHERAESTVKAGAA